MMAKFRIFYCQISSFRTYWWEYNVFWHLGTALRLFLKRSSALRASLFALTGFLDTLWSLLSFFNSSALRPRIFACFAILLNGARSFGPHFFACFASHIFGPQNSAKNFGRVQFLCNFTECACSESEFLREMVKVAWLLQQNVATSHQLVSINFRCGNPRIVYRRSQ